MATRNQSLDYFYELFIPMRIIQINRKTRSFLAMKLIHFWYGAVSITPSFFNGHSQVVSVNCDKRGERPVLNDSLKFAGGQFSFVSLPTNTRLR